MSWKISLSLLVGLACALQVTEAVSVMSIDLGNEWMKVAVVSPGVPMEIALNKESKRKTPAVIAFRGGERTFGEDAASIGVRFPRNSYSHLLELLGKRADHPLVELYRTRFPHHDIRADPKRGTVVFQHDSDTEFSVEELVAMLLQKAREFAQEAVHGQTITDAVITVPGYFNQAERLALLQAAQLAGIKVLQLINDYTAVALNYGIFRRKDFNETAQYLVFYDMGASATTASVVSYQLVKTKERGYVETNPQLTVLGVGYDRTLGGLEMQLRLRDHLATKFNEMKKTPNDVFKNPRALAKLLKEAGRVKNVLSANNEHTAQVEGLLDEVDFRLLVNREQFEAMCDDVLARVNAPLERALASAGLSMDVISQVVLVGAGTRVPSVQERLLKLTGSELGKSLNTDEAAVMGAVYKAADLSAGFKVKKFITKDAVLFPIQVVFERQVEGSPASKQVRRLLFSAMNPFPQKKIMTFNKHTQDFTFRVNYAELDHLPAEEVTYLGSLNLSVVHVSGVSEALRLHSGPGVESKGIKAHFLMDDSGVLSLNSMELQLEKTLTEEELAAQNESPLSKLGATISQYFTGSGEPKAPEKPSSDDEKSPPVDPEEKPSPEVGEKPEADQESKAPSEENKPAPEDEAVNATKPTAKSRVVNIREEIAVQQERLDVSPMQGARLDAAVANIAAMNEQDQARRQREGALNALESFVFETLNKLELKEYRRATTEKEAGDITKACSEVSDWLSENADSASLSEFESRLSELSRLAGPMFRRVSEHAERPEALAALKGMINGSSVFLQNARNMTQEQLFTDVELDVLEKAIKDAQEWMSRMVDEQKALKPYDTPKLTVKTIAERMALLDREVKYLVNKAKIWKPKKKPDEGKNETVEEKEESVEEREETAEEKEEEEEVEVPEPTSTQDGSEDQHTEL